MMRLWTECREEIRSTLPEDSLLQCIFSDTRRIVLSAWTTYFIAVCIEVSYGAVICEGSCCTRVTPLDKIVEDEGTLWAKTDE
jgi:hypothetical protein